MIKREYYNNIIKLAVPVIIANIGQILVQIIDTIMVGRLGSQPLASAAFASMLVMNVMMFGMGLAMGMTPNVGYNYVEKRYRTCSKLLQNGLLLNCLVGAIMVLFCFILLPFLDKFGQPQDVIDGCKNYYMIISSSLLPYMIFLAFKQFMDGLGNTKVSMIIAVVSNILNVILNYLLIYGKFGFPELGMEGAAIATLISRIVMPIMYIIYIRYARFYRNFLKFFHTDSFSLSINKTLLVMGMPIAAQLLIEFFALSLTSIMMGWIGTDEISANQVVFTTISLFYLFSNGISSSITILVSHNYALGRADDIRKYSFAAAHISMGIMIMAGLLLYFFGSVIASIYISDSKVIEIATSIFAVVAFMELFDGLQITTLGVLRGMGDVVKPMYFALVCYGVISLSVAYYIGFGLDFGAPGIWCGFAVGVTVAFILFSIRIKRNLKIMKLSSATSN